MTIPNFPMVTSEIVELVEAMRHAQLEYDALAENREVNATQHQLRRADQSRKAAERKVDAWLSVFRAEIKKYHAAFEVKKTDDTPGMYLVERE